MGMVEGVAEWRRFRVRRSLRESHRPTQHGSPPPTQHTPLPSLSLHMRNLLGQCMLSCSMHWQTRATPAQHSSAYQIIHTPQYGEHRDYMDVALGLQPRTTTQLQGNELRPHAIHYADDTVLLFPVLPFLLCLLFFDALSHHVHVFLFVSVNSETEMASHDETAMSDQPA